MTDQLLDLFPALNEFSVTSPQEGCYNCIAWAAGTNTRWWWPHEDSFWPPEAPMERTLAAFVTAFSTLGYEPCADGALEDGFERVAIYKLPSGIQHAARQLSTGRWTREALTEIINLKEDRVLVIDIGPADGRGAEVVKTLGRQFKPTPMEVLVV